MQVTREIVKQSQHLITDYMYKGDNVGIDLYLLNQEKTHKEFTIPSIPITYEKRSFTDSDGNIKLDTCLRYEDGKIQSIIDVLYATKAYTVKTEIPDETFAKDIIKTCLEDKQNIKKLPCYTNTIQYVIDSVKEEALENESLIKENEMNYKCYVYSTKMELLGVANRLLLTNKGAYYILGEYIGKSLEKIADDRDKVIIDICINDEITLQLTDVNVTKATNTSVAYAKLDLSMAKIKRIDATYESISLNIPKQIALPNYNPNYEASDYFDHFSSINGRSEMTNFYKLNKPNMTPTINVNKYLIG